jgi:L-asparaginase II
VIPNRSVLTADRVAALAPVAADAAVRVELDGRTLFERGDPDRGAVVRRGVLVARPVDRNAVVDLAADDEVDLSHRTAALALDVRPGPNTTVHTVRVNGRVVLHNETGLTGETTVPASARRSTELTVEAVAEASTATIPSTTTVSGRVDVSYTSLSGEPATLVVTVDV